MIVVTRRRGEFDSPFASNQEAVSALSDALKRRLVGNSEGFAVSLVEAASRGRASSEQMAWIHILAAEALKRAASEPVAAKKIDFSSVNLMFARATVAGLKNPRMRASGLLIRVGRSGRLIALRVGSDGSRKLLGEVVNNELQLTAETTDAEEAALKAIATDPLGHAKQYGDRTGCCAYCGLTLTTAESVGSGYGPICAEKWGLPWSDSEGAKRERMIRKALKLKEELDTEEDDPCSL